MSMTVSVKLDEEQVLLLEKLLQARRDKCKSRIIREALWCYGEKILPEFMTNEIKSKAY
jgi:predicted transcriptional regulator